MKPKQVILLSIALLMPVAVFLFLKGFGKNEFTVPPMFTDSSPTLSSACIEEITLPYAIPPAELQGAGIGSDSLSCVSFHNDKEKDPLSRVKNEYAGYPVRFYQPEQLDAQKKECVFLLQEPFDVALVDRKGRIRGQYNSTRRDEIDRLITEIAIIFKKY